MSGVRRVGRPRMCPDDVRDLVIELHRRRLSLRRIARHMNEAGYLTPAGKTQWNQNTVSNLLATRHVREVIEA
jgi:hypothetical protein